MSGSALLRKRIHRAPGIRYLDAGLLAVSSEAAFYAFRETRKSFYHTGRVFSHGTETEIDCG
jgi:hypothetical protein